MRNNFPKDAETTKLLGITREDEEHKWGQTRLILHQKTSKNDVEKGNRLE
jgi:hypothetical protein